MSNEKTIKSLANQPKSKNYTVQASIILKTPIFVPVGRVSTRGAHRISERSDDLRFLKICKKYGYDEVIISGQKLSLEVDFKVWAGCLLAMQKFSSKSNFIAIKFTTFVELCGYDKSRINKDFRNMIDASLARIKGINMSFRKQRHTDSDTLEAHYTSLLKTATVSEKAEMVTLEIDPELWDLYQIDHEILVSMQNLELIKRAETAQCLYLYLTALPSRPHPISMAALRERCELSGTIKNQNKRIKAAFKTLEDAGLVKGEFRGIGDNCKLYLDDIVRKAKIAVLPR